MATKAKILWLASIARELGMPVEKMGLSVDGDRVTLLPPGGAPVPLELDTSELEAWRRKKHAHG